VIRLVIVESPYAGDVAKHATYLQRCILDCLARGESPYASHQMLTTALDDANAIQRAQGMLAGFAWRRVATVTAVYCDYGISHGMTLGIQHAISIGHPIEHRTIGLNP
jgi:hypothetical protein